MTSDQVTVAVRVQALGFSAWIRGWVPAARHQNGELAALSIMTMPVALESCLSYPSGPTHNGDRSRIQAKVH